MKIAHQIAATTGLTATRKRLGLSQQQLAIMLNVSRSLVSMAEISKRSLPTNVLIKLACLEIQIAGLTITQESRSLQPAGMNTDANQPGDAAEFKKLQYEYRGFNLASKLEQMNERYKKLLDNLDIIEKLIEESASNAELNKDDIHASLVSNLLQAQRYAILKKLGRCGLREQASLRSKLAVHHAEFALHQGIQQHFMK